MSRCCKTPGPGSAKRVLSQVLGQKRDAFRRRQTILLSTEDVGLLGLKSHEYQKAKRVRYQFSGTTDAPGVLYIVLIYNNRGLHIDGRRLQVVTLHE